MLLLIWDSTDCRLVLGLKQAFLRRRREIITITCLFMQAMEESKTMLPY